MTAQFGAINVCPVSGENHNWSDWDEKNSAPTCTDNGTRTRYCYDCLYKFTETTNEALNHSYGEWSYGRMKQERQCQRCFLVSTVQYVNLYEQIEKIQITGEVFASDNWTCLYDGDWEQEYPVFCGKNNPVTVDIALKGEIFVDCIFVKGASDCTYTISVLYAEDNDYTVISTEGKFGEKEMRFDINGQITDVKVYMENATPEGYWQEIAIAKIPEVEQ